MIGTAIGLNLLFGIPLEIGVIITALDVFLILWLQNLGFRWIEALIVSLLGVIAVCFAIQIALADPDWGGVIVGFAPTVEIVRNPEMLYLALGIIGATVMPHNLYLHSAIVQTRAYGPSVDDKREALKFATIDSTVALMFALLVNASILILAAATFHKTGRTDVAELGEAQSLLLPLLGASIAPSLFAIALLCCGLNSTVTATLAGQAVMEGFINFRLPPWLRRLDDARRRDHPGGGGDDRLRRKRDGEAPDPVAGRALLPAAVRGRAAGHVHGQSGEDGRAHRAALADGPRRRRRGSHHRAQHQDAGRPRDGLSLIFGRLVRLRSIATACPFALIAWPMTAASCHWRYPNGQ